MEEYIEDLEEGESYKLQQRRDTDRSDVSFGDSVNFGRGRFVVGLGGVASETVFVAIEHACRQAGQAPCVSCPPSHCKDALDK